MNVLLLQRGTHVLNFRSDHVGSKFPTVRDLCRSPYIRNSKIFEINLRRGMREFSVAVSIFQSTSVTKPEVNDLPFAAGGTEIEKVRSFFL